jgi:hypothetical protein
MPASATRVGDRLRPDATSAKQLERVAELATASWPNELRKT